MGLSKEWTEWHLTASGWIAGDQKTDFASQQKDTPDGTVLSVRYSEFQVYERGPLKVETQEQWRSPDAEIVSRLVGQFGDPPLHL